jgi:triosephosphate isomerase (TIM)
MTDSLRQCVIVGNWKMYKTIEEALSFAGDILPEVDKADCLVIVAVPFTAIKPLADKVKGSKLEIAAQNMNDATEGAFTGEVSAVMLKDAGASYVILGHSERRRFFHETNDFINRKVKKALQSKLKPILCIGETYEEREAKQTEAVLEKQLRECLAGVSSEAEGKILISYEPVWAIGTGKPAKPDVVEEAQAFCRKILASLLGEAHAEKVPILYGGSVTPKNANEYLEEKDIDGLLIGSASLSPESFAKIIALRQNKASA